MIEIKVVARAAAECADRRKEHARQARWWLEVARQEKDQPAALKAAGAAEAPAARVEAYELAQGLGKIPKDELLPFARAEEAAGAAPKALALYDQAAAEPGAGRAVARGGAHSHRHRGPRRRRAAGAQALREPPRRALRAAAQRADRGRARRRGKGALTLVDLTLQQGKVADKAKLAQDLVAQAATAAPADALRHLARARVEADAALGGLLLLHALGGKAEPTTTEADAQGRLATLLGSLVVTVVDGDHQRAAEGKGLSQPIVFSVWLGGKPAAGLPLAARIEGGRADDAAVVGPDGRVSLRVVADSKPVASAVAVKKGIGTTRVLVLIQEKIEGGDAVSEPPVTASVTNALQTAGFALQDKKVFYERVRGDGVAKLDVEELKKQARGFADVVVFGTVTSRFSSNFGATTVWHRARADVRAIDVNTGQVVFQSGADETKGKRPGELNVAGRAALEAMGADLGPRLEKTLSGVASQ